MEKFGHKLPYVFFYSYNDIHIVCCKLSIKFFMQKDEKLYADCSEVCPKETCDANSVNCLDLFVNGFEDFYDRCHTVVSNFLVTELQIK